MALSLRGSISTVSGSTQRMKKERILAEEACFGGKATHDKGEVTKFDAKDSVFIMEHFAPERKLLRPEQFLTDAPSRSRVFVLDLNGHFCVAVPATIKGRKQLILFNTTQANYLNGSGALVASMAFDLSFVLRGKTGPHTYTHAHASTKASADNTKTAHTSAVSPDVTDLTTPANAPTTTPADGSASAISSDVVDLT